MRSADILAFHRALRVGPRGSAHATTAGLGNYELLRESRPNPSVEICKLPRAAMQASGSARPTDLYTQMSAANSFTLFAQF